jgi:hypothetical protein
MKYRSESFFSKYQINPNIPLPQLRVMFQTDPNRRKDLPIVIKTISNQQVILEEELFTIHEDDSMLLTVHSDVLKGVANIKTKVTADNVKAIGEKVRYLCSHEGEWNSFYYAKGQGDKATSVIKDFLICIFDELKHEFTSTIGEVSNTDTTAFYSELVDIASSVSWISDKKDELIDDLCEYADNLLSLGDTSKSFENKLSSLLVLADKTNHDFFKSSLRYAINKMVDDIDTYGDVLLNNYKYIVKAFKENDLLEISTFIAKVADNYCDVTGSSTKTPTQIINGCKKIEEAYELLKKSVINIQDVISGKNSFKIDDMNNYSRYASFLSSAGNDWYEKYRSKLSKLGENCTMASMYDIVAHVISAKPNADMKDLFANIIIGHSDFKLYFEYILTSHAEAMDGKASKYLNPKDIDEFIGKYYWIIYMLKDTGNLNENAFNNIRNFAFDILQIYNDKMKILNITYDRYSKSLLASQIKEGLCNALKNIPPDYYFDDKRVVDAIKEFGGTHYGSPSESSLYIDKYCDLFGKSRTKHGRAAYENRNSSSYSYSGSSYSSSSSSSGSSYSSGGSSSGGCYVATCVYGSYDCPEVWILRRYRDCYLDNHWFGKIFIKMYYAISPTIVKWFGKTKWFKKLSMIFLEKKIQKLRDKCYADTPYNDKY